MSTPGISVSFVPESINPALLAGRTAVVVDLLRATTTIVAALHAGAAHVVPCLRVEDALRLRDASPALPVVLGGERAGVRIEGFDLANSPDEYTPDRVAGRAVIFTTSNGTKAILAARAAASVLVASFANVSAVVRTLVDEQRDVHVVCAGTDGRISAEDCLFAGRVVHDCAAHGFLMNTSDEARMAAAWYRAAAASPTGILDAMRASTGGRNLIAIGFARDVERCAREDWSDRVPVFDPATGVIR